jgi:hypothetical protein
MRHILRFNTLPVMMKRLKRLNGKLFDVELLPMLFTFLNDTKNATAYGMK